MSEQMTIPWHLDRDLPSKTPAIKCWPEGQYPNPFELILVWTLPDEQEATLNLLMAAPTLLDACETALANLRHLRDEHPAEWDAVVDPALATAWDKLQQAILAAKGGAA